MTSAAPRVLVALQTCSLLKYEARTKLCLATWARVLPPGYDLKVCTGAALGVPDVYDALVYKSRASIAYAHDRGYDHLLSVDDDTILRPARLHPPAADYAGWATTVHIDDWCEFCQGGAYWLSRRAMEVMLATPLPATQGSACDGWTGRILREHGILPVHLSDYVVHPAVEWISKWRPEAVYNPDWTALLQVPDAELAAIAEAA